MSHYAEDPFVSRKPVEAFLAEALTSAERELDAGPIGGVTAFTLEMARIAIEMRRRLVVGPGDPWLDAQVAHLVSEDPGSNPTDLVAILGDDGVSPTLPPVGYAMAVNLAREFTSDLPSSVQRVLKLRSGLSGTPLNAEAQPYVYEGTRAFTLGLFIATLALTRAGFEHAAQDWLASRDILKMDQAQKRTAGPLLDLLTTHHALDSATSTRARALIDRANRVMHRGSATRVTEDDALASIWDLHAVLAMLL